MYKKTMHKIRKAVARINRYRIRKHVERFIKGATNFYRLDNSIGYQKWAGFIQPSTARKAGKPYRSKYNPH